MTKTPWLLPRIRATQTASNVRRSFAPLLNRHTHTLIIGSMPGEASLRAKQYYAYPRNQFWPLMYDMLNNGQPCFTYQAKCGLLLAHGLGLWDSLQTCQRTGSLDSHIQTPVPNDFPFLFRQYPAIRTLLFNGQAAWHYFHKFFDKELAGKQYRVLPSTSPAHASLNYLQKKELWQQALKFACETDVELL